jgi:hypothetical protein
VAVLPGVDRRSEAGQDEQRVVDAHADSDQPRDGRRPVGNVDDVGEQQDQPARRDAEPSERHRQGQAGGDDGAERDQKHDRGAEEPDALRARLLLRDVNRIAAKLDLEPATAVLLGGLDQPLAVLLLDVPARDGEGEGCRGDLAVIGDTDWRLVGHVIDLLRLGKEAVDALHRLGAPRARGVLPDHVDLLA